jgi:hypothetical protein
MAGASRAAAAADLESHMHFLRIETTASRPPARLFAGASRLDLLAAVPSHRAIVALDSDASRRGLR